MKCDLRIHESTEFYYLWLLKRKNNHNKNNHNKMWFMNSWGNRNLLSVIIQLIKYINMIGIDTHIYHLYNLFRSELADMWGYHKGPIGMLLDKKRDWNVDRLGKSSGGFLLSSFMKCNYKFIRELILSFGSSRKPYFTLSTIITKEAI